ncbi:hypothetical protein L1887_10925 [Cichorium endivia]|nr:hypothetical protein L1887_10925 [Cichorium endivia]
MATTSAVDDSDPDMTLDGGREVLRFEQAGDSYYAASARIKKITNLRLSSPHIVRCFRRWDVDVGMGKLEPEALVNEREKVKDGGDEELKMMAAVNRSSTTMVQKCFWRSTDSVFQIRRVEELGLQLDEILIDVGLEEPSLWIWVTVEMVHGNLEETSGIDKENYIVINQEQVVDGIANFMARYILLNPNAKNLKPKDMQKKLSNSLGGMSKFEKVL